MKVCAYVHLSPGGGDPLQTLIFRAPAHHTVLLGFGLQLELAHAVSENRYTRDVITTVAEHTAGPHTTSTRL